MSVGSLVGAVLVAPAGSAQTVPTLPPVSAGAAPQQGAVPVVVPGTDPAPPAPSTTAAPRVVPDALADAAVAALAALKGRPAVVMPEALPQPADPTKPGFEITLTTDVPPGQGVTVNGVPGLTVMPVAAAASGQAAAAPGIDAYGAARLRVAQLVASRAKGASGAELDAVWARTDPRRMTAVFAALSQVGTLYRYTGNEPGGFDCSGLTSWAWAQAGVKLPRISTDQINATTPRAPEQLLPGDLVWRPGHIMMSLGGFNLTVDSPSTGKRVTVRNWGRVQRFGSPIG